MANYDEVVKRNKDYLTQAQINALAAASKEYNIANAGNRAGALESARQQYDTAYRGLQNMGLAGNPNAAPASGEVPRLQMQIKTPFDSYNERLKQVENQRLGALGEQFKQETIAQREAEEAARRAQEEARRAQEEAMRRAQLQAAAQTLQSKALKIGTTVMKGVANKLMGISSTKKENPAAVAAATKAQVDGLKRTQQVQQQTVNAAVKAQIDGMNRTARPQDVAAAAAFNIAHYSQQPAVTAANAAQERGMKLTEQYKGAADTSKANQYYVDANQKAFTKEQAEVEYKEAQNNLTNLQQKRHGGGAVSEDEYKAAVYQRDAAKLKAENPKLYQSFAIIENPYADAKSREEAGNEIMRAYGYTNDERTAEQYTADKKKAAQYSSYLATFDDKNASAEEKKAAENMLKNMGVTPDQAREFISKHRQARAGQGEYSYYKNAILNSLTYAGKTPSRGVNKDETDPLYRAVNKLNAEKGDDYNLMYSELAALPDDVTTGEEYVGNELRYITEDERNAYNYIYETEGLAAANQYIRDGLPLRNVRAAIDDEAYAKQLVENSPVAANFLSIAAGTFGNVPAMIEKLVKGTYNFVAQPQTPLFIDTNDDRLANMSNLIQSATSQKILESNPGTSGKIYNFAYQTGMSMAQSAVAMTFAAAGAPWAVDVMFFSSAGNEAYKDAIERGATQEQALASGVLSGVAEALFEHASIEHFMNLDYQGKGRLIKNMLSQAGAEASEEINTELANILTDAWVMRDKSNYNLAVQQYMSEGMDKDVAENKAFMDQLGNVGMAGLGGLVSGLGFGVFGALPNAVSQVKTGKEAKASKVVDQYVRNAALLGGDAQRLAQEVNDAYGVKKTKSGSIETEKVAGREKMKTTEPSNRLVGALVQQVNKQVQELAQSAESGAAVQTLLTGEKLTTNGAKAVMDQLGADTVKEMGYDTSSPSAFAKSFNARLQENSITPRMQEVGKYRQAAYGMAERRNSPIEYQEKYRAFTAEDRANAAVTAARANASNRVWANPTQGMAMTTPDGTKVTPMPGNMRAVEQAEQERTNFKARSTATKGNVTYAVAGMEAREGLSNEQTYSEIQKGLTKEARQKAQLYEKLASALGVKMIIHDVMTGTNGFIDEKGNMHVVLSGKQSVLRVAAHELTHYMKDNAKVEYSALRSHLIAEVGNDKFDRMVNRKASEYGIDLSTEKGKVIADDEVCAELCERMLSNEEALEKFAEKDTAAAKTLKEHLLKILNAIKSAFKRAENRDFGESWSDLIKSQDTIESWITGLQKAIDNAGKKTVEKTDAMRGDLFLSEEDEARAERKKQAEENAEKGTYVRGISAKEMDSVLSNVMVGDKSNYEGDDYEHSRAMIAQLVPEVIDALNGEANLDDVQAKLETAVGEMVDNYFEEYGDGLPNLRSKIDATIGISDQAKGEIEYSEKNMRKVANEISHALGKRVTLVGETNPKFKTAQKLDSLWEAMNEDEVIDQKYNWSTDVNKLVDFINDQSADRVKLTGKERENTIYAQVGEMIAAVSDMLSEKTGKRYSLDVPHEGIEMKKPVEGTDKLIAIHNLTGDELSKSLARGGFPMPSIAIMKQSQGHNRYGDVSVIFGRDTIDPRKSSANKVYSGDAWTPTYPAIEHKPRKSVQDRIDKTYFDLQRRFGSKAADPLYRYVYEMEKQLNNAQSEKALLDNLYNDTALMQLYNQSVGNQRVEDVYKETKKEMTENEKTVPNFFIKELGEDFIRKYEVPKGETPLDYRREFIKKNRAELERVFGKMLRETFSFEQAENILEQTGNKEYHGILRRALKILDNETTTVERTFDYEATQAAIRNNVDQKAYRDWVYDLFHGIYEKSGIRNNKDYYTQSGNARSWDALHDEETLENVVRVMKQMEDKGSAAFFSQSGMLAVGTRDFKSIDEIRKHKDQLQHISDDEMSAAKSSIVEGFNELMEEMRDKRESNQFIARDHALDAMVEAVKHSRTPEGILRELKQWHGLNVTNDMGKRIADLVEEIANLPTEYFEAKPKRAVGANEIKTVILPEGKYSDLEKQLSDRGIPVVTYEYENDEDRLRALQSSEVSRNTFSLDTDYMRLAEKQKAGKLKKSEEKELRKMVDDAAKATFPNSLLIQDGEFYKMWHHTSKEFNEFLPATSTSGGGLKGIYFTPNEYGAVTRGLGDIHKEYYLNVENAKVAYGVKEHKEFVEKLKAMQEGVEDREQLAEINRKFREETGIDAFVDPFNGWYNVLDPTLIKSADLVTYDDNGNIIPLSERFRTDRTGDESWKNKDIRYSIDTDAIRQAFTVIDTTGIEDGLEALKDVKHVGSFALKDISRFLDASAGKNKDLRNTLHAIFEAPHSEATGRYARGVERMQQKVLDIGKRAGVCDEKGKHFDSKKSAAIQNIGEGFSNTYTDLKLKVKDADHVTVKAYEPGTDNLVDSEKDYTLKELRQAYGTNAADYVWSRVFDETQKAQETGGKPGWVDEKVNTRPYTIDDLQTAYPNDWQKLKAAADEFRQMYDEYIRDQNNMLATIYPIESEYADVEKLDAGIEKKQERLAQHKAAVNTQIENLQKSLEAKEKEIASKKRTDTKAYRQLVEQANKLTDKIAEVKAEIAEYEANVKDELVKMNTLKAEMQNAVQKGDYSLKRMHRLQYRSDYFHHFTEMASGIQNLKSIFTNNTDIAPAIVGKSEGTKAKTRWAGYFQQRMGGDYTADALNGMLRYGQLAEYKLAFDPLTAYLRDVNKQIRNLSSDTNRDGLIRYIDQWADAIAGKSHKLDRVVSDAGMAPRKAMQVLQWINSRVIQNTLLWNMRSALVQISNITNAKGIVKNNIDWVNGLKAWALAAKGDETMASIMSQSNFLASRYMDGLALTDSKLKSAKQFAGWMLGALDEISAKATWWAAYQQYTRNPNAAKNQYRNYDSAVDYADDITRRTHAGRGVGELAPAMTSRVINFVAPFQVEVNNTWQLLKDNVKQKNYLGLLSTGLSVFLFNTAFEAIVGSTPLGFDFIRAVIDIALGFLNDDPDDDPDAKEIAQRFAGELVGGLPFASQLVAAFGEDNAKKVLGENNDATRYGNTQIGVNAVVNAAKGLKDIGTGLIEGRRVNWLDDLDDLMNLTLPMGAKQLTRTAQGLATVAKGYAGKYDKEGNEKVQFVTDQDVLHYIHAGLFGKWALTEASEYFGEKRLLPELFGAYNGKKSSIGTMVDAKEYKAALDTGIDGKDYFTLKYDLKSYTTQAGKRAEMMEQSFTPEQKAKLDALMLGGKDAEMKAEGAVVYQKSSDGEWKVKADYSNQDMFDLSTNGDKIYTGTIDAMEKTGLPQDQAALAANMWEQAKAADDSKQAFRDLLRDNKNLTVEQKEALDKQYCGNKYAADYSDPDLYELSTTNRTLYDKAKAAKSQGIPVKQYVSLNEKKNAYTGEDKADYLRREVMNTNLTAKQKEALDDILISDKDRYIDYSSKAWFEISMLGKGQYTEAKEGTKVGLKPETYLTVYKKWKTLDAKDENGNTRNGLKKKRAKEYLDSLSLSGPEYSYIWTAVFGYK